ncbi:hypothetical protein GH5_05286 [Leishmania sp. Ghana 2012 LV757]|uniref:hypothetical protein n=1 Tax=Leishmania sp. Ghana 2012 LV757 TaxID=2803181 RepID=UPI001B518CA2|nr:hypothetical protein GH5_05286 [Leishmania sp. Ghana 2012 LV757]
MPPRTSALAYEDEPYWIMCLREYLIPGVVFTVMFYYLSVHVLMPMRRIYRPTRRTPEVLAGAEDGGEAASSDNLVAPTKAKLKRNA